MRVYSLSPLQFAECYGFISKMMLEAYRNGAPHHSELFQDAIDGSITVWLVVDGATPVAFLATRLTGKTLRIVAMAGRGIKGWLKPALRTLHEHARANGASRVTAESRKGLGRVLGIQPRRAVRFEYEMEVA